MYLVGKNKEHIAKVPKKTTGKNYVFGKVSYPSAPYSLLKFGKANVNEAERENYEALPAVVRKEFTPDYRMIRGVVVQERVMDFDGTPSLSMIEHEKKFGKIDNKFFWEKIDQLKEIFTKEQEPLFNTFGDGSNIMVKKISETEWKPMLIDYKRLGRRSFPFQADLLLKDAVRNKFLRQFRRFEERFRPESV
jgi:hypothetical protein